MRVNTFRRICFGISPPNPFRTGSRGKTAKQTYRSKYTRAIHGPGLGVRFKHGYAHRRVPSSVMAPQTESVRAFASKRRCGCAAMRLEHERPTGVDPPRQTVLD